MNITLYYWRNGQFHHSGGPINYAFWFKEHEMRRTRPQDRHLLLAGSCEKSHELLGLCLLEGFDLEAHVLGTQEDIASFNQLPLFLYTLTPDLFDTSSVRLLEGDFRLR